IVRILKKTDRLGAGHQLVQQRESLRSKFTGDIVETRQVASRPIKASNKAELHGVSADVEHNWDAGSCSFSASVPTSPGETITATRSWTRSAASAGSRSAWFPAQRYSITKFRPSM